MQHAGVRLDLNADDLDVGAQALRGDRDAGEQSTAADGSDDDVDVGRVAQDLQRNGSLPGDDERIVERGHERRTQFDGDALRCGQGTGKAFAFEHDPRAVMFGIRGLGEGCVDRHHDGRRDAERSGVVGDALRVVAGRRGDHAALALFGAEPQQEVARAALFERRGELEVLEFQPHTTRAGELRERAGRRGGRRHDRIGDRGGSRLDLGEGHGQGHGDTLSFHERG